MISFIFKIFCQKIFLRKTFLWKIGFELLSIFFTIVVIYYASQSFILKDQSVSPQSFSLFVFLLVGEVALILPMSFAERLLSHFLEIRHLHFYHTLIGLKISPTRFILSRAMVDAFFPLTRVVLILILSTLIFNFHFSLISFIAFFLLQFFAIILFSLMALITTLVYLKFNRGIGIFYTLQSFGAIVGGVYFPIDIFPAYIKNTSVLIPQTQILNAARSIFQEQVVPSSTYFALFAWPVVLAGVWVILDRYLMTWLKKKGQFFK